MTPIDIGTCTECNLRAAVTWWPTDDGQDQRPVCGPCDDQLADAEPTQAPAPPPVWSYVDVLGHGPIYVSRPGEVRARCEMPGCVWVGPDRTGDPHAAGLVIVDVDMHLDDAIGVRDHGIGGVL